MNRSEVLNAAYKCVNGSRETDYGSPEDNFTIIANLWTVYLTSKVHWKIEPRDVAAMMTLVKIARVSNGAPKEDNWVDIAGYAACGGEIESNLIAWNKYADEEVKKDDNR